MEANNPWFIANYRNDPSIFHPELIGLADLHSEQLIRLVNLSPEAKILDLAGGAGRIALPLARRGLDVTVQDTSATLLEIGKKAAEREGLKINWIEGDMRTPVGKEYDLIISMFTSFGYFSEESENDKVLSSVRSALSKNGKFVIDLTNKDMRMMNQSKRVWKRVGELICLEEHSFDVQRSRWILTRTFLGAGNLTKKILGDAGELPNSKKLQYDIRLYSPQDIDYKLKSAGFSVVEQFSNFEGRPLSNKSWRTVSVAN